MSPIKRHSFCLYFYLHHLEIVSYKAVIATVAMLFLIKYLLLRAWLHLLNLIHLPAQSAWKKPSKIWVVKGSYSRRFVLFDFSNSVCLLWQVVRFQSEQEQDTSLDPKSRLWKGAISLSDSGTKPRLSSCPLPPPLKGIGLGTWGLNVAHLVIRITRAQCKV